MKTSLTSLVFLVALGLSNAQPPANSDGTLQSDSVRSTSSDVLIYQSDSSSSQNQVPHQRHTARTPTDSTKSRYAKGGKSERDGAHTKKYAARKDTTFIHKSYTRKSEKSSSKRSASTKKK